MAAAASQLAWDAPASNRIRRETRQSRMRKQSRSGCGDCARSLFAVLRVSFAHKSRRLESASNCEWQMLQCAHFLRAIDHVSGDRAERDLAQDEPAPFDSLVEYWIDHGQRRPQQACP